jgi:hypothetical protein
MTADFGYDPELTIQDADIEMMELRAAARQAEQDIKNGRCPHGWSGPARLPETLPKFQCYDCGKLWANRAARDDEQKEREMMNRKKDQQND